MIIANATQALRLSAAGVTFAGAAEGKPARATMLAYAGGVMTVGGVGRVVIDLAGLEIPASFPLLADHNPELSGVIGQGSAAVRAGQLFVEGQLTAGNTAAGQIVTMAKAGHAWQASVGVEPIASRQVRPGDAVNVNNRTIKEDRQYMLVTAGRLRETSILSIGADPGTSVSIAARGTTMNFEDWLKASGFDDSTLTDAQRVTLKASYDAQNPTAEPANPERLRAASVLSIASGHPTIAAQAVADGWDEARTRQEVLGHIRTSRSGPSLGSGSPRGSGQRSPAVIEAAFLIHAGYESLGEKMLGAQSMQQGRDLRCRSLLDILAAGLQMQGVDLPSGKNEIIRAALSTISLPVALGNAAGKMLLQAYLESVPSWQSFATIKPAANFKEQTSIRPNLSGQLEQVANGGEIKHATMSESTYTWSIDTFAKMIGIDRKAIVNDDLGLFNDTASGLGRMARRSLSDFIYSTILANASNFYSSGHANYVSGSTTNLSTASLGIGIAAMRAQRDADGNDLDIAPKVLVVPPELEQTAKAVLQSDYIQLTATSTGPTGNTVKDSVQLQVEPRLSNDVRFTGTSEVAWYLFAGPNDGAVTVGFLDGQQSPTVEFFGLNSEPNRLEASWRVYLDYGAALSDYRAAYKSKGEA